MTVDPECSPSGSSRRRPRICILTETYYPVVGGGERQAQILAADLVRKELEVRIVTRRSDPGLATAGEVDGVPVHRIGPTGAVRAPRWRMILSSLRALTALRHEYDVVFVSGFKALGLAAVPISRLFGKVCILKADSNGEMSGDFFASGLKAVHMTPAALPFQLFLAGRNAVLRRAHHFVAITAGIAEELRRHGVDRAVIHTITNSVDTETFRPLRNGDRLALRRRLGIPQKRTIVTYTGRLVTYKGLPLLVRVAERLQRHHDDVGFVLIGSGGLDIHNCEAELRAFVGARGLEHAIHFAGEVSNVHEFLQASDIFVLPTEDDAFPLSLVEAMACGLPVVSTPVGGIPDIVTHGENGLLVAPGDFDRLHAALRDLIGDPGRARSLGEAAALTVRRRYSREMVADRYLELFSSATSCGDGWPSVE
jgi:glycosyltransferase involved in cell wall biosynthesis